MRMGVEEDSRILPETENHRISFLSSKIIVKLRKRVQITMYAPPTYYHNFIFT